MFNHGDPGNVGGSNCRPLESVSFCPCVVYRKEQFRSGAELPAELLVRDRRYEPLEIRSLCSAVGLKVEWLRCVRAGAWETELAPDDDRAKELLLLCSRLA